MEEVVDQEVEEEAEKDLVEEEAEKDLVAVRENLMAVVAKENHTVEAAVAADHTVVEKENPMVVVRRNRMEVVRKNLTAAVQVKNLTEQNAKEVILQIEEVVAQAKKARHVVQENKIF